MGFFFLFSFSLFWDISCLSHRLGPRGCISISFGLPNTPRAKMKPHGCQMRPHRLLSFKKCVKTFWSQLWAKQSTALHFSTFWSLTSQTALQPFSPFKKKRIILTNQNTNKEKEETISMNPASGCWGSDVQLLNHTTGQRRLPLTFCYSSSEIGVGLMRNWSLAH